MGQKSDGIPEKRDIFYHKIVQGIAKHQYEHGKNNGDQEYHSVDRRPQPQDKPVSRLVKVVDGIQAVRDILNPLCRRPYRHHGRDRDNPHGAVIDFVD